MGGLVDACTQYNPFSYVNYEYINNKYSKKNSAFALKEIYNSTQVDYNQLYQSENYDFDFQRKIKNFVSDADQKKLLRADILNKIIHSSLKERPLVYDKYKFIMEDMDFFPQSFSVSNSYEFLMLLLDMYYPFEIPLIVLTPLQTISFVWKKRGKEIFSLEFRDKKEFKCIVFRKYFGFFHFIQKRKFASMGEVLRSKSFATFLSLMNNEFN